MVIAVIVFVETSFAFIPDHHRLPPAPCPCYWWVLIVHFCMFVSVIYVHYMSLSVLFMWRLQCLSSCTLLSCPSVFLSLFYKCDRCYVKKLSKFLFRYLIARNKNTDWNCNFCFVLCAELLRY